METAHRRPGTGRKAWGFGVLLAACLLAPSWRNARALEAPLFELAGKSVPAYNNAYFTYTEDKVITHHLPVRLLSNLEQAVENGISDVFVVSIISPGDEIFYLPMINSVQEENDAVRLTIQCDARLFSLFSRSMPHLRFTPVKRLVRPWFASSLSDYDRLPSSRLSSTFDNDSFQELSRHAAFIRYGNLLKSTDEKRMLWEKKYLIPDPQLVERWRVFLSRYGKKKRIGICWRTYLQIWERHPPIGISLEQVSSLFDIPGAMFFRLQYDGLTREERNFLGRTRFANFEALDGVDQFADIENFTALIETMDLIITPSTNPLVIAAALGKPVIQTNYEFSSFWKMEKNSMKDRYHPAIVHVLEDPPTNHPALFSKTKRLVEEFVKAGELPGLS